MPLKKENRSLIIAIVVTFMTAIVFLFLFLFLGINHRKDVYNDSKKLATEISRKAAYESQVYLSSALLTATSLEKKLQLLRRLNGSRQEIHYILKSAIVENPNYLGVWTLWEPNTYDHKDNLYKEDPNYNKDGTLGIGYFQYHDTIYHEVMTSADYIGPHYTPPKENKTQVLIEPYKFVYTGYDQVFFATTVSVPIIVDNEFLGAIGIDIDLGNLQKELNKRRLYETGYLSLIASNGKILTHIDTSFIEQNIFDLLSPKDTISKNSILNGRELAFETISEFTNQKVFRSFYPIVIGEGNKPWSMMIEIPLEKANARSKQLLFIAIITLIVGFSLLLYLVVNIVERMRYEKDLLISKNQAEESNRLKTAFLNNISHEIRTPMNGILGFTELLVNCNSKDAQFDIYRNIIKKSSKHLLSVISNVIELSKIQAQQIKLNIREFEVVDALRKAISGYKIISEEENVKLRTKFPDDYKEHNITSDEDKFIQVVSYLLNNAFKFTEKGFVEIGYEVQVNNYLFYVMDSGKGIKPENKDKIFENFTQGNVSSTRKHDGLGVGLTISKSFIEMLGGSIWFDSELGKGTTFYFCLPKLIVD